MINEAKQMNLKVQLLFPKPKFLAYLELEANKKALKIFYTKEDYIHCKMIPYQLNFITLPFKNISQIYFE